MSKSMKQTLVQVIAWSIIAIGVLITIIMANLIAGFSSLIMYRKHGL